MARVSTIGADRVALRLETQSEAGRRKMAAMMQAGAETLMQSVRTNIGMHGLVDTGRLQRSLTATNYQLTSDGASIDVTFSGSRRRGKTTTRNAAIGFIQNYGRKYSTHQRRATNFFTDATSEAKPEIISKWTEMMHDDN